MMNKKATIKGKRKNKNNIWVYTYLFEFSLHDILLNGKQILTKKMNDIMNIFGLLHTFGE